MQISMGMALVRGAGAIISYLLRDEFTTDRAAGAVNGTAAEPGGQTRTVTDGNSKLTIASGLLTFATGGVGAGNPGLWYPSMTRQAGLILLGELTPGSAGPNASIGLDTSASGGVADAIRFNTSSVITAVANSVSIAVGSFTSGNPYLIAVVARANGCFFFIKEPSDAWKLLYVSSTGNGTVFPAITVFTGAAGLFTSDYIRIPTDLWLPTPLASDGFATSFATTDGLGHAEGVAGGIGAGGSGLTWTGATWSVSGAKAINTPGLGSELAANGSFAADANWSKGTGWTIAAGVATKATGVASSLTQGVLTFQNWYQATWTLSWTAGGFKTVFGVASAITRGSSATFIETGRSGGSTAGVNASTTDAAGSVDDFSVKLLPLADLFSSVSVSTADVVADVNIVVTAGTQAGLVLNLDSAATPANFVIAYHNGTNAILEKCVAGVYTTVLSADAAYSAGATLRVAKIGSAYRVYYNNALVGSATIADAGIISNTRHGLFSTYGENTLDNFVLYASGSGGEYAVLDNY